MTVATTPKVRSNHLCEEGGEGRRAYWPLCRRPHCHFTLCYFGLPGFSAFSFLLIILKSMSLASRSECRVVSYLVEGTNEDVLRRILQWLTIEEIHCVTRTCRTLNNVVENSWTWELLFVRDTTEEVQALCRRALQHLNGNPTSKSIEHFFQRALVDSSLHRGTTGRRRKATPPPPPPPLTMQNAGASLAVARWKRLYFHAVLFHKPCKGAEDALSEISRVGTLWLPFDCGKMKKAVRLAFTQLLVCISEARGLGCSCAVDYYNRVYSAAAKELFRYGMFFKAAVCSGVSGYIGYFWACLTVVEYPVTRLVTWRYKGLKFEQRRDLVMQWYAKFLPWFLRQRYLNSMKYWKKAYCVSFIGHGIKSNVQNVGLRVFPALLLLRTVGRSLLVPPIVHCGFRAAGLKETAEHMGLSLYTACAASLIALKFSPAIWKALSACSTMLLRLFASVAPKVQLIVVIVVLLSSLIRRRRVPSPFLTVNVAIVFVLKVLNRIPFTNMSFFFARHYFGACAGISDLFRVPGFVDEASRGDKTSLVGHMLGVAFVMLARGGLETLGLYDTYSERLSRVIDERPITGTLRQKLRAAATNDARKQLLADPHTAWVKRWKRIAFGFVIPLVEEVVLSTLATGVMIREGSFTSALRWRLKMTFLLELAETVVLHAIPQRT